jgi:uncharacterized protein with beta-barrel porin domain
MRRLVAIAAVAAVFLFLLPAALAAEPTDPALAHTGRVLISTGGDITLPAGDQADAVIVVDGTATIEGTVNTVVVVDGSAILTGARTPSSWATSSSSIP